MNLRKFDLEVNVEKRLAKLVTAYCSSHYVDPTFLLGPGRQRLAARARAAISHQALTNGVCTLTDLARYFGRAPEVVARGIKRYRTSR